MIDFEPVRDRSHAPALTDQIVSAVVDAIREQRLRPGMAVPSIRQFARTYGVSTFTVSAAYNRLVAQGVLTVRPGAAYRVAPPPRPATRPAVPAQWTPPDVGASWLLADVFADHSIPIKSGCGWLPPEWLNGSGLSEALRQMARTPIRQMGSYGHPWGYYPLREQLCGNLEAYGLNVTPEQVLLTQGATQGLDVIIRTLFRPGDVLVTEVPAYANMLHMLRMAGITVLGVSRDEDGLRMDELESLAREHRIKAVFVNTVLHNPTGTSLSMSNAFRLLQLAERHDFWVIEDDVSRDLLPGAGPLLAAMAGTRRVVYVSGFSKSITPALRVGYVVADPDIASEFAQTKMATGLTSPEAMERTVYQVLRMGHHRKHVQRVQERLRESHDMLTDLMDRHGFEIFARPRAGLFLWARPPAGQGGTGMARTALKHGIWLAPGTYFYPQGHAGTDAGRDPRSAGVAQDADPPWIRFNVAYSLHPDLWSFMSTLRAGDR